MKVRFVLTVTLLGHEQTVIISHCIGVAFVICNLLID